MSPPPEELEQSVSDAKLPFVREVAFHLDPKPCLPNEGLMYYLVAGQPGAGKSGLRNQVIKELGENGAVHLDLDAYRQFHPDEPQFYAQYGVEASDHTHVQASKWMDKMMAEARTPDAQGAMFSIIHEGTAKSPDKTVKMLEELKAQGYGIAVRVMAVNQLESRAGIIGRYVGGIHDNERDPSVIPRSVPAQTHDEAYAGLVKTLEKIEEKGLCPIEVYKRGMVPVAKYDPQHPEQGKASSKLQAARDERWSADKVFNFQVTNDNVAAELTEHFKTHGEKPGERALIGQLQTLNEEAQGMLNQGEVPLYQRLQAIKGANGVSSLGAHPDPQTLFNAYAHDAMVQNGGKWSAKLDEEVAKKMLGNKIAGETVVDALATSPTFHGKNNVVQRWEARAVKEKASAERGQVVGKGPKGKGAARDEGR